MDPTPQLPAEDRAFLVGSPKAVEELITHHRDKFVSGGLEVQEDSVLLKQPGLHPGSPRHILQHTPAQSWEQQEAVATASQVADGEGAGGQPGGLGDHQAGAAPAPAVAAAVQGQGQGPRFTSQVAREDGDEEFVYGQAAESLDFAAEEMDAE